MGPEGTLLGPEPAHWRQSNLPHPVITEVQRASIVDLEGAGSPGGFTTRVLDARYEVALGGDGLAEALARLRADASAAVADGADILVISDRSPTPTLAHIPSLLATGAVHHHLIRGCSPTSSWLSSSST